MLDESRPDTAIEFPILYPSDFIPWAWGLNGFASVVSASLATLLAIEFGFTAVVLFALVLYVTAAAIIRDELP